MMWCFHLPENFSIAKIIMCDLHKANANRAGCLSVHKLSSRTTWWIWNEIWYWGSTL